MGSTQFAYITYNQHVTKYTRPRRLRYRVVAVAAPRVATKQTAYREPQAFKGSVLAECLEGILGTGRGEAA